MTRTKSDYVSGFVKIFSTSGRLKSEPRKGWISKLSISDPESVSDHCFRTALMTMILSDSKGLDTGKAVKLALLHDLPESLVGDATPEERHGEAKIELETAAMKRLLADLPPDLKREYQELWYDFIGCRSPEAELVRQVDKLEMALQAHEYVKKGHDPESGMEFIESTRKQITDDGLLKILKKIEF